MSSVVVCLAFADQGGPGGGSLDVCGLDRLDELQGGQAGERTNRGQASCKARLREMYRTWFWFSSGCRLSQTWAITDGAVLVLYLVLIHRFNLAPAVRGEAVFRLLGPQPVHCRIWLIHQLGKDFLDQRHLLVGW